MQPVESAPRGLQQAVQGEHIPQVNASFKGTNLEHYSPTLLQEAVSGEYEIAEQSPAMVRRMIDYFYRGNYNDGNGPRLPLDFCDEKPNCSNDNELPALCIHARMFALADMYQVEGLRNLAVTKYGEELNQGPSIKDILDSIPDVYQLTPSSVRTLRDKAVLALRLQLERGKRPRQPSAGNAAPSGNEMGGAGEAFMEAYSELATESPEFLKDLLSSYIRNPLLGHCPHCGGSGQLRPTGALQMKCLACGKGGARSAY